MSVLILFLILFLLYCIWRLCSDSVRVAVLLSFITLNVILLTITEVLSLLRAVTFPYILISWLLVFAICIIVVIRNRRILEPLLATDIQILRAFMSLRVQKQYRYLVYITVAVSLFIGLSGALYEPNSSDSLQYHLPRISHWIQNRNVDFFPTTTIRELVMPPGSEFAMLHLILLSGSDRLGFLAQWGGMLGALVAVSLLAKQLGAKFDEQVFAVVIAITIPVGILEASGTLNDYLVSFWILCFAFFALEIISGSVRFFNQFGLGASLGLAILTKSTAYIYALPVLIWIVLWFFRHRRKEIFTKLVLAGFIAIVINLGPLWRNYALFGNFLGPQEETKLYTNGIHTPIALLSNIIRNVSLHLNTPVAEFNSAIERKVVELHKFMRIDVNDPRTTFISNNYDYQYRLSTATRQEIYAGNMMHFIFIGLSVSLYLSRRRFFQNGRARLLCLYMWIGFGMFVLFCFILKWQPFHSRQHLAFFLYFSPFIAIVIAKTVKPFIVYAIAYAFLILALPWALLNSSRPLVPVYLIKQLLVASQAEPYSVFSDPNIQLFREMESLRDPLVQAMDHLASSSCRDFGMIEGTNTYQVEYPLWKLLARNFGSHFRLKHLMVTNDSRIAQFNRPDFEPCVIISFSTQPHSRLDIHNVVYEKEFVVSNSSDGSCCTVSLYRALK